MTRIMWNSIGQRRYEVGIDRGVLYLPQEGIAVPWNGLTSVSDVSDTVVEPLYFNGIKYYDYVSRGDYKGTLKAFTYPEEFELYDGVQESGNGIFVTGQIPTGVFHLSYRTMIGDDIDGVGGGYKIHVLYNLTAKPSNKTYSTINNSQAAQEFSWELSSVPMAGLNLRPSSHIIFDTTKMHEIAIAEVEQALYGTDTQDPQMKTIDEFEFITTTAAEIEIVDNGDGTWSASGSDYFIKQMPGVGLFTIKEADAVYLDDETYEISTTES
ncbi:major tail protein [Gordonia phage Duffington]|uniref:Minor tail protein n=1 Tax=Gordonia phage Duffington TaxID=2507858 RepID=A0A410TCG5_9CAUD|nr:major tail protein [Gordonia phage Duffington]QAU06733.1 major tail protein [Gordonia phage Duffington]